MLTALRWGRLTSRSTHGKHIEAEGPRTREVVVHGVI